jgi:penicillin-binding protein 2
MFLALEKYINEKSFRGGAGLMMDIDSGEIIAMVSLPEYSSTIMTEAKDKEKIKSYLTDKRNPFLNKATYGEYTPGSIIKPFVALAGLTENLI